MPMRAYSNNNNNNNNNNSNNDNAQESRTEGSVQILYTTDLQTVVRIRAWYRLMLGLGLGTGSYVGIESARRTGH